MSGKLINNIVMLVLVAGLGVAVYLFFFADKTSNSTSLTSSGGAEAGNLTSPDTASNREFIASLNNLKAIKLETAIFSNPEYLDFKDFSLPLDPEPAGRPNPFVEFNAKPIWLTEPASSTASST